MALIVATADELKDAVNAAGFDTYENFIKFLTIGRLQTEIGALTVANTVLDVTTGMVRAANEAEKQTNNAAIATLQAQLAALVNS